MSEVSALKTIEGINQLLNLLPTIHLGSNAIANLILPDYGAGQIGYDKLKTEFQSLDFSKLTKISNLNSEITAKSKELNDLEKKHASLVTIFGEDSSGGEGTLTHSLLKKLESEIDDSIKRRDDLRTDVFAVEKESSEKINAIKIATDDQISKLQTTVKIAKIEAEEEISQVTRKASGKVRIIEQFSDFLAETNSNMFIYAAVIFVLVVCASVTIYYSIPDLLSCFQKYSEYVTTLGAKATSWQLLNYAFGILIVKLPWAFCLSAVFTGMYRLLKSLLTTYEKINQDKRNMSAIYAVSGNIAQALNEYGLSIANYETKDENSNEPVTFLKTTEKEISQKRESLKWNQILNYFEGMQNKKEEVPEPEDTDKIKALTELLGKAIEKLPTGNK